LFPQCGQRSSQEAQSEQEHGSLTFGRRRYQRANRFDIEHPIQIGV
jgi:hypothetical protein